MNTSPPVRPLLEIRDLSVRFATPNKEFDAAKDVSLTIHAGERVALVGESGSGKSVTAASILGLLPYPQASHPGGSILFEGEELLGADEKTQALLVRAEDSVLAYFQQPDSETRTRLEDTTRALATLDLNSERYAELQHQVQMLVSNAPELVNSQP